MQSSYRRFAYRHADSRDFLVTLFTASRAPVLCAARW